MALAAHHQQTQFVTTTVDDVRVGLAASPPQFGALLATRGDAVVGFASYTWRYSIWNAGSFLDLDDVFVDGAARGAGVGLALMTAARELCRAQGGRRLRWEVEPENLDAIRFYQRLGAHLRPKGIFTWSP